MEPLQNPTDMRAEEPPASRPAKFLFDVEFESNRRGREEKISPAEHERALAAAEEQGYRRGQAAARGEAETHLAKLSQGLGDLFEKLAALEARLEVEAVEVAIAVARKLSPALIAREPTAEIAALVTEVFAHVRSAPHLAVRVGEDLLEAADARLKEISAQNGYGGRLVLLPEPEFSADDCRIEWADGGVERNRAMIEGHITEAVARYLGRNGAPQPASDPETDR